MLVEDKILAFFEQRQGRGLEGIQCPRRHLVRLIELRQILVGNVDPWRIELQEAHQLQATQFQFRTFGMCVTMEGWNSLLK